MLTVKLLADEEFDTLPYPEARISLGLADTKTGQAFVRLTKSDELNKYLISHELEHLLGEDRDEIHHGGDGVYYKGFGNIFSGLGQAFQGAGRSVAGAGQSLFGGAQKIGESISGAGRSVMGMFGQGQPSFGKKSPINIPMMGMQDPASRLGSQVGRPSMLNQTPSNRVSMPPTPSMKPLDSFSGARQVNPAPPIGTQTMKSSTGAPMSSITPSRMANFMPPISLNMPRVTTPAPQPQQAQATPQIQSPAGQATAGTGQAAQQGTLNKMFGENPAQTITGGALSIGSQLPGLGTPRMPDISELPSVQQLRNFNFKNSGELDPALEDAVNRDMSRIEEREYQEFIGRYKSLRPGADIESDTNFKRDLMELKRMQGERRSDTMAKYRFEMISKNLQLSQAEVQNLQSIAQLDIQSIMFKMGLDYGSAQKFKDTFSRAGDYLITSSLGIGQEKT